MEPGSVGRVVWYRVFVCLLKSCLPSQNAQLLKKLNIYLEGYVPRKTERDLEPRLMASNTLTGLLLHAVLASERSDCCNEISAFARSFCTLNSAMSKISFLVLLVLKVH